MIKNLQPCPKRHLYKRTRKRMREYSYSERRGQYPRMRIRMNVFQITLNDAYVITRFGGKNCACTSWWAAVSEPLPLLSAALLKRESRSMVNHCSIVGCSNRVGKKEGLSFYRFPLGDKNRICN